VLGAWLGTQPGLVALLARDELADITVLTGEIDALEKRIAAQGAGAGPVVTDHCRVRGVDGGQGCRGNSRGVAVSQ
jgi:hypothetical protein